MTAQLQAVTAQAPAAQLDTHNLAVGYLWKQRWENRVNAMAQCIEALVVNHDMTEAAAELATIQAYAELDAANQVARIDLSASTADVVVLRTEGGRPVMFTTRDLLRVLEQARAAGLARVVDRDTRRPVVLEH